MRKNHSVNSTGLIVSSGTLVALVFVSRFIETPDWMLWVYGIVAMIEIAFLIALLRE